MNTKGVKRKLAAILSADVKGYSRLMGEDEVATVRTLTAYREVMASLIQQHRGRVVDSPGDNVLAEFASVVDAVQCAVEIQQVLRARNAELPENRRMEFRIGVNLGDVIQEGERIYGDGVNIAARVEGLAEPGGICISGSAYEQIENKLPLRYQYLGEHSVKNITRPIRVYKAQVGGEDLAAVIGARRPGVTRWRWAVLVGLAVVIVAAGAFAVWNYVLRPFPPGEEVAPEEKLPFPLPIEPSIAVMPFENMSGDPGKEHIADGISENIIAALSKIPNMIVSARNATFAYKGKRVKLQQLREELGVRHVLEGSVLKSGDRLRVTAQLVDAREGHHLWTEQYEKEVKDLLSLIDEITNEIVVEIRIRLRDGELLRTLADGTDNPDAWHFVYQSLDTPLTKEGNLAARKHLEKAFELDHKYAAACSALALTHGMDADAGWTDTPDESNRKALQFTQKALELDASNALAHALLGAFHKGKGQYGKAIAEGEKAMSLGPKDGIIHSIVAMIMFEAGRTEEAIELAMKAMQLAPYYPPLNLGILALAYHKAGRFEEAFQAFEQALKRIRPGEYFDHLALLGVTLTCVELGRYDEARAYAAQLFKIRPNLSLSGAANVWRLYKDRSDLKRFWNTLRKAGIVPPIVSSAEEFRYKGPPAFTLRHPAGKLEKEPLNPEKVFSVETYEGLIEFHVFVEDIPKGIELEAAGREVLIPKAERDLGTELRERSHEKILLADGTEAYKTEMEWTHRKGFFMTALLVSAYKENKWVYGAALTVGDPSEIEELARSLKFVPVQIPVKGWIHRVREANDVVQTYIDVEIGEEFSGRLPDSIDSIKVTGPSGDLPVGKDDFQYIPEFRDFWIGLLGSPEIGTYTFTVTSGNMSGTATDSQTVLRTLPIPDSSTFSPGKGETLSTKTPTFSWGELKAEEPLSYRLEIRGMWGGWAYMSDVVQGMLSCTVPEGKLAPGRSYIWRVRVADGAENIQNRSNSEWLSFTMAQKLQ